MVSVRRRAAAVNYAEPKETEGLENGSDEEQEQREEDQRPRAQTRKKATPSRPRAPKRSAEEFAADLEEEGASLLEIVKNHGASIAVAAKDWVDRYKESRGAATAELLTLLLQACGVDRILGEDDVEEGEVDALKQELDKQAQEDGLEDYWRGGKPSTARAFRANYLELWDKVVREAADSDVALWDQYLLDRLTSLLIALNTSVVREFRAVATLTASQLVTSWIYVSLALGEARDTAERQLAAEERKKGGGKAAAERCAAFRRTLDRCHARVQELKSYTDSLFQGIFAHRFRDCSEEIRATVIDGIGCWIRLNPGAFLTDQYLKYIAWALSDKDARVRLASVTALLSLYANPDNSASLADFTQRFAQRFGELFYDIDERVAVKGVQLNTLLVRLKEAQPSQFARVYELLADESAAVRHAVAELVASALEEQGAQVMQAAEVTKSGGAKRGQRRKSSEGTELSISELQLAGLLQVMHLLANPKREQQGGEADQEEPEGVALEREIVAQVIDALYDRVPMLSDWALLLSWAQQGKAEEHFGEAGMTNLLHLLRDSLRKATGGLLSAGAANSGSKHQSKEKQQAQAAARQDATLALMKELPALLRKVQTDPVQAAALVGVIPEMKLEVYALKRQENAFGKLGDVVRDTFLKHADADVARECVVALAACAASGPDSIKDAASLALSQCTTDVVACLVSAVGALERADERRFRAVVEAFERSGGEEEGQLLYDVRSALVRLHALLALSGPSVAEDEEVQDALHALLESVASGGALPEPVVRCAMRCQLLLLMWRLRKLDSEFPEQQELQELARLRSDFVTQLDSIAKCSASQAVRDEVSSVMADCFLVFSASKSEGTPLESACFSPTDEAVHSLWGQSQDIMRREIEVDEEDDASAIATKMGPQRAAANKVAQLAVFQAVPQHAWLAAQLISQWVGPEAAVSDGAVRRWAPVAEVVKETARLLKKTSLDALPRIYLNALKAAYERMPPPAEGSQDDEEALPEQEFLALSDRIAKTYAGFNSSATALEYIIVEGSKYALREGPHHLVFLEGVAFFVRALNPTRVEAVKQHVEAAAATYSPVEGLDEWETYFAFLDCLDRRAAKGNVKSVLKKAGAAAMAKAGDTARKAPRKISFAAINEDVIEESEEEEEDEREPIEPADEDDDERPSSLTRMLARSSGRPRSRLSNMSGDGAARHGGERHSKLAPVAEQKVDGIADNRHQPPQRRQQAFARLAEAEAEEEEEDLEVLPTEEAMAIPGSSAGRSRQAKQRKSRLQSLFAAGEQAADHDGQEGDEDEEVDLRNPFYRQQPVVDLQVEEEEEERPARRRRRR